jgi:hypothetical protein
MLPLQLSLITFLPPLTGENKSGGVSASSALDAHPHLTLPPSKGEEVYDRDSLKANDFNGKHLCP